MAITYDELIRRVPEWLYAKNRKLIDEMPAIITQAHEQLINTLDHDLFKTLIDGKTLAAGDPILDLSTETPRVLEVRSVRLKVTGTDDGWTPILRRDLEMLSMLYARNKPRRPLFYTEYNGTLILKVFPSPALAHDVQITANVEPEVLSETVSTNIMAEEASRALEKAVMRQACLFMKAWEDAAQYSTEMTGAITEVNAAIQRRRRDDTEQRPRDTKNVMGQ